MRNRVSAWNRIRADLKRKFLAAGITSCEKCRSDYALSFAHRHSRAWYYRRDSQEEERLLGSREHVSLLCIKCHGKMDDRSRTTEEEKELFFNSLQPL